MSVILPVRDSEKTIRRAVTSTLRAMPRDSELVVLDDGSTDSTVVILDELSKDTRLRVLQGGDEAGRGVGPALAKLMAATDSQFVARMDADDISMPWRFRETLPLVRTSADLVFTAILKLQGQRLVPGLPASISPGAFRLHLLLTNPACHPTLVARREAIDRVGGYRAVPSEDYDLWMRCATSGARLLRAASYGLIYRIHPTQVTASKSWQIASWADSQQAAAYADLSERVVGRRLPRLVQIAALDPTSRERAVREFETLLSPAIAELGGLQGAILTRRLRARVKWVRDQPTATTDKPEQRDLRA
ncbi:MAG: glycosyltransferase [Tessaracoccus sp.]|uniref:glycosyltransferase family 2 protein n=1 Tax=Tessaracoccus sp. TaxID=1971211 RepID=UPI001EB402DB|nr:glycosyltransferase [Tessaracoccus sp.]MBK7822192.1 glycosyltransferase [Tessaracoccus sp.]